MTFKGQSAYLNGAKPMHLLNKSKHIASIKYTLCFIEIKYSGFSLDDSSYFVNPAFNVLKFKTPNAKNNPD